MKQLLIWSFLSLSIASWANASSGAKKVECTSVSQTTKVSFEFNHEFYAWPSQENIKIAGVTNELVLKQRIGSIFPDQHQGTTFLDLKVSGVINSVDELGFEQAHGTYKLAVDKILLAPSNSISEGSIEISSLSDSLKEAVTCKVSAL
jgi:hypothetical protein